MTPHVVKNVNAEISLKDFFLKIKDWFSYLIKNWLYIILFGITGSLIGLWYAFSSKAVYSAVTTFVLEGGENGGNISQYAGLASMVGIDLGSGGGGLFQGDNLLELYKSRKMIEKTLLSPYIDQNSKKTLLINKYIESNKLRIAWQSKPSLARIAFNDYTEGSSRIKDSVINTIVNDIRSNYLSVGKPDKKLSIIKVEVKSADESFAKDFNDQIVKNVNDFYVQTKTKKSLQNVNMLQTKVDSVRSVMTGAIYRIASVTDATPNLNPTKQSQRIVPVQQSQFSAETNKAILGELVKNLEFSKMALLRDAPLIQEIDQPIFPLERQKTGKLKSMIIGGIVGVFLIVAYLLARKFFKDLFLK
jgi:hypothetical protein